MSLDELIIKGVTFFTIGFPIGILGFSLVDYMMGKSPSFSYALKKNWFKLNEVDIKDYKLNEEELKSKYWIKMYKYGLDK